MGAIVAPVRSFWGVCSGRSMRRSRLPFLHRPDAAVASAVLVWRWPTPRASVIPARPVPKTVDDPVAVDVDPEALLVAPDFCFTFGDGSGLDGS